MAEVLTRQIGRYRLTDELGRGAMGVVYRAEDPTIGRTVAVKTTRVDTVGSEAEEMLERLRQEARAAGVLNHPNLVTIYDAGEQDGLFYIAMEFVEGVTLQTMLAARGTLTADETIDIVRQICAGLDYAHARGIVHRDIKPANIMITAEGGVKIMDFGIARSGGGMTTAGQVLGTPNYMSPEQVRGKPLDGRSDLFSVGVILYECLTGKKPFAGDHVTTIIYKIVQDPPVPPSEINAFVDPALNALVMKTLAKSPAERPQRGWDLARELMHCKPGGAVPAAAGDGSGSVAATGDTSQRIARADGAAAVGSRAPEPAKPAVGNTAAAQPSAKTTKTTKINVPAKPVVRTAPRRPARSYKKPVVAISAAVLVIAVVAMGVQQQQFRMRAARMAGAARAAASLPLPTKVVPSVEEAKRHVATKAASKPAASAAVTEAPASPAAAAPAAASGELKIVSTPAGATIQVDGRTLPSPTPTAIAEISAGTHVVMISKPGYRSAMRSVHVEAGQPAEINAVLASTVATLSIASNPAGATINVDGADLPQVTPAEVQLRDGAHNVLVRKPGFQPAQTTVQLHAGERFDFSPVLAPLTERPGGFFRRMFGGALADHATLQIRTQPRGAQVLLDGDALPKQTPLRMPIEPGTYRITIRMDGFKTVEREVTLVKGKALEIDERLVR